MAEDNIKSAIEALLFASDKPLTPDQIKKVLGGLDLDQIKKSLEEIGSEYEQTNRGIRIVQIAGGFQMITSSNFAPFLKKLYKERGVERLSRPALETLAIIAYKQPVTKYEIESLRNVNIDGVMGNLLEKDLIRIAGRKKAPGRPKVYGTTRQFLEYFGLKSLDELPKIESLSLKKEPETVNKTEEKNGLEEPARKD